MTSPISFKPAAATLAFSGTSASAKPANVKFAGAPADSFASKSAPQGNRLCGFLNPMTWISSLWHLGGSILSPILNNTIGLIPGVSSHVIMPVLKFLRLVP